MIFQLPNGRAINMSLDEYLGLTDEEIQFLVAYEYGSVLNNPRHGSVLGKLSKEDKDIDEDPEEIDEESEHIIEVDQLSRDEVIEDLDQQEDY